MGILSIFKPDGPFEKEFHSERFQAELNRLRRQVEGYQEAMQEVLRTSRELEVIRIANRALGRRT